MITSLLIIIGFFAIALMSMVMHEYAHGYVAARCGDYTAEAAGRLTLNPLKHIDPFMTILLPVLLLVMKSPFIFGGAKPIPVNPYNLRHRRRDGRLVSAAGVVTNLIIAILLSVVLHLTLKTGIYSINLAEPGRTSPGVIVLGMGIIFNLVLFAFNLLPIPPLDGSRLLRSFLPAEMERLFDMMDRFGIILIFILFRYFGHVVGTIIMVFWHYVLQLNGDHLRAVIEGWRQAINSIF